MKTILLSILLGSCMLPTLQAQDNYVSKVWVADQGDGTYKNPVLYADYSDPEPTIPTLTLSAWVKIIISLHPASDVCPDFKCFIRKTL